ncbi:MAG: hypothetical protein JW704_03180 [Anaerolineaceae bacterium]|nr:hypothetical protein [Anaerolineaceae bacterium]MBN2678414.1 hypothetical protein [Anaerolineaceae bacterium]
MTTRCSKKDRLLLSRYLAGALSSRQKTALEPRLASEKALVEELNQLKQTRNILASLPTRPVPHNFTIKAGELPRKQSVRLFPVFRMATTICGLLFVILLGITTFTTHITSPQMAAMSEPVESEEYATDENQLMGAAPKAAQPLDTPQASSSAIMEATSLPSGAGVLTAPLPELNQGEAEDVEKVVIRGVDSIKRSSIWVTIAWVFGIISVLSTVAMFYFYYRERV